MSKDYKYALLLDYYGNMLTEKQRLLLDMYYNSDMSLAEIAEDTGITRQGAHDGIKRSECLLDEYEGKLHLMRQTEKLRVFRDEALLCIKLLKEKQASSSEADKALNRLEELLKENDGEF